MYKPIGNERDIEVTQLLKFIATNKGIKSALDVGAHWTWNSYAKELKKLVKLVDGIDIAEDPKTSKILDHYFVGNVTEAELKPYDLVCSISSIEHSGISTYKVGNYKAERLKVFQRMYDLAKKYLFITCPFGQENLIVGQYANVTGQDLEAFRRISQFEIVCNFYFTPGQGMGFSQISEEDAYLIPFDETIGIPRCIAILMIGKV